MKRLLFIAHLVLGAIFLPLPTTLAARAPAATAAPAKPAIESVRGRLVRVRVPAGVVSVTLERLASVRLGRWETVATKVAGASGGVVDFQLPAAVSRRFLRVKGGGAATAQALRGATLFLADPTLANRGPFFGGPLTLSLAGNAATLANTSTTATDGAAVRAVSESDIWRVAGDRLYFFNELRGLQVFDITNPDDPALLGQLRIAGAGEQMYLLNANRVALLTRTSQHLRLAVGNLAAPEFVSDANSGSVVLVDVAQGRPVELARVAYRGSLRESRLVGSVLYVVSEVWGGSQHGLEVTSFDLADPAHPVARDTLFLGNYGGVITATDRFLFVVGYGADWNQGLIDLIDISSPTGALVKRGRITAAGHINDKFKMHLDGDTFTAISAIPRRWVGNWWERDDDENASRTKIETFSLANPDAPVKLGSLELGVGETVRATRFDEKRLYVVTFFQIDPLWVVDLTNPAKPTLLGELEVPGFSNYIEPLGDRLVAVGRVGNRTAVSLFDVSDPAHPRALSQLPLGADDASTDSEANWDEKAFNVVPEENLIVVPYSGYDPSGYAGKVQLIDLTRDALVKRGVVEHGFFARRTTIKGNRLLAISSTDLVTVNFADRDHPVVTSEVEIAWRVDRVFLAGSHLLQLGGSAQWGVGKPVTLTVSTASDPDHALTTVELDPVSVVGATVRDGRLYVAQYAAAYSNSTGDPIWRPDGGANSTLAFVNRPARFILSIYDLASLPALPRLARTESETDLGYLGELAAAWPGPGVLVWVRQQGRNYGWNWYGVTPMPGVILSPVGGLRFDGLLEVTTTATTSAASTSAGSAVSFNDSANASPAVASSAAAATTTRAASSTTRATSAATRNVAAIGESLAGSKSIARPIWHNPTGALEAVVFDVSDPTAPTLASKLEVRPSSSGDWSEPFAAGGKLYVSSVAYEEFVTIGATPASSVTAPSRMHRHFLRVVDLTDPAHPVVGGEVNIPGRLVGLTNGGARLFTLGCRYADDARPADGRALHASDFDGAAAQFVDQIPFANYDDASALDGETILLGVRATETKPIRVQAWKLDPAGKFQLLSETPTTDASALAVLRGLLVAGQFGARHLYDVTDAVNVRDLGEFPNLTPYWQSTDFRKADGSPMRGLWEPLDSYGVNFIEFAQ